MNTKRWWGMLMLAVCVLCVWLLSQHKTESPAQHPAVVVAASNAASGTTAENRVVRVPTGAERLSNAVRCMAYTIDLANKLPNEEKREVLNVAGLFFFDDALMTKMNNGRIVMTTNELCQLFSNAVGQVYSNHIPPDVSLALYDEVLGDGTWGQTMKGILAHEAAARKHPNTGLVHGFDVSFGMRNNLQMTADETYKWMGQSNPALGKKIKMVSDAISAAGVTDASQSDLKNNCLSFAMLRTWNLQFYGRDQPDENRLYLTNYEAVMTFRLVNMFGLDENTARKVVRNVERVPVDEFNRGDVQPPAYLQ